MITLLEPNYLFFPSSCIKGTISFFPRLERKFHKGYELPQAPPLFCFRHSAFFRNFPFPPSQAYRCALILDVETTQRRFSLDAAHWSRPPLLSSEFWNNLLLRFASFSFLLTHRLSFLLSFPQHLLFAPPFLSSRDFPPRFLLSTKLRICVCFLWSFHPPLPIADFIRACAGLGVTS